MTISINELIPITSSVINPSFTGVSLSGLFLTKNPLIPNNATQKVLQFTNSTQVGVFFEIDSDEYKASVNYFNCYDNSLNIPPFIYFARYIDEDIAPYITGGSNPSLITLKSIDDGSITLDFDGTLSTFNNIDLTGANSFSDIATIIENVISDGEEQVREYDVTVNVRPITDAIISSFSIGGMTGIITGTNIAVTVPNSFLPTNLIANFSIIGSGAKVGLVDQVSGTTPNDFTLPIVYTITALDDTTTVDYTVTVTVSATTDKVINTFTVNGVAATIAGTDISFVLPHGTDVSALVPVFTMGAEDIHVGLVAQVSGVTPNDFTNPVVYIVEDNLGGTVTYTATATVSVGYNIDIMTYSINDIAGIISPTYDITVTLPYGTNKTALIAVFTTDGAKVEINGVIQESGVTVNDFTNTKMYSVFSTTTVSTCVYNSIAKAFVISNGNSSGLSTVDYSSVTPLTTALKLTQTGGAVLSQGSVGLTPAENLVGYTNITRNWASFTQIWDISTDTTYALQLAFTSWVASQQYQYAYVLWSTESNLTIQGNVSNVANALVLAGFGTKVNNQISYSAPIMPNYGNLDLACMIMGIAASIDYTASNGVLSFAYKSQTGIVPLVTNDIVAETLASNGFNFYGAYSSKASAYNFTQNGSIGGIYKWFDFLANQLWLADAIQNSISSLFASALSVPNNQIGYSMVGSVINDVAQQAINNGVITIGNYFSNAQIAILKQQAGKDISEELTQKGWSLIMTPATPEQRANRQPPKTTFWYTNAGSINTLPITTTLVF